MAQQQFQLEEVGRLTGLLLEGELGPEDRARFERMLLADPAAMEYYQDYVDVHCLLHWQHGLPEGRESRDEGRAAAGLELEGSLPSSIVPLSPLPSPLSSPFIGGPVFSYMAATVIVGMMLLGAWAHTISRDSNSSVVENSRRSTTSGETSLQQPEMAFVGRVTGLKKCRWSDPLTETYVGASVPLGRKYALASGLLEIVYTGGARVILEGPCTYKVESDAGGYLSLGKLTARVESAKPQAANPQAPAPSPLFTVRTPTAVVTDLGTEFGVEVRENGDTFSRVFQGRVVVRAESVSCESNKRPATAVAGDEAGREVQLAAGESMQVSRVRGTHQTPDDKTDLVRFTHPATQPIFVRRMVEPLKQLNVLDIIAGGDGRGNQCERGIDPTSGRYVHTSVDKARDGDGQYRPILWNRTIDGVFVPGGNAAVQLDSAGNTFDGFSGASGRTFGNIWARAADAVPGDQVENADSWIYSIGRSARFMPGGRGLLALHPNAGITFNLQAVRERYPESRPAVFRATIGLADSTDAAPMLDSAVDFRVFVDGRLKLERIKLTRRDGAIEAAVALGPRDRFLTLAATDGGDGITSDWFVLGDPTLKMTEINNKKK